MDYGVWLKRFNRGTTLAAGLETILYCLYCDILAKIMAVFYPCPNNLPEAKLTNDGLLYLAEIPIQPNIARVAWSLVINPEPVYSEKEQWGKKNYKMYSLKKKITLGNVRLEPRLVLRGKKNRNQGKA